MECYARAGRVAALMLLLGVTAACRDEAPVKVTSLRFDGVHAVDEAQLRGALHTKAGSWIPFSKKPAFDTDEFQNDLQRLRAFYIERGYPDARVTDVDVLFDDKKEHVRLTVTVREGEPVRVEAFPRISTGPNVAGCPGVARTTMTTPLAASPACSSTATLA